MGRYKHPLKLCPYTQRKYRRPSDHRRTCEGCRKDYEADREYWKSHRILADSEGRTWSPQDTEPAASAAADTEPQDAPRQPLIVIDAPVGEDAGPPKYKAEAFPAEPVAEVLKPEHKIAFTDDTLGLLFETPIAMLTDAGIEAPDEKPGLSPGQKKLLVQTWRGPINRLMEKIAGKNPELAAALLITLIIYGPVSYRALAYRKQRKAPRQPRYRTDTQRGLEEAGIVPAEAPPDDAPPATGELPEEEKDEFARRLR